ncbi:flagellar biosynthesis protein FlhA [Liquorilactobacillus satsumensis]|uniref:Flagellar biosynthesis protein FlhA n=2 Tax=Liquorilactobacillus satsumensis TaxID=259059 RepID=A0A0R1V0D0_9LACO|nr:flagellar biosynthesis protein FlhA [Liquorilactobacillus satsumensis]AJA34302.1 flagellar biosynthesis protein FlhA [Liquorilactobacillus satsumensis]KRL99149.1 flagellar biosynthesis protein FlhA [Liquorilactobacillus satsumensis DSM 16230 = JCM 12392]MCC7666605.1 flagellar biosynthesis protein FlhA [Liquorilactobacillus satsumensis]MCP9312864.1 flagellar biosynthesis protein FlhA [Liquorilactobacillus satsumensis]MCP9329273.1 flagellar biosynthesis protein FlhA [Liquorilactobacillus sats
MSKAVARKRSKRKLNYADVIVSFLVVSIIGLIIVPLPAVILDVLIVINLTVAINILLITLFTHSVLEFTTFPTLLLLTTMFKLGLNMASTRLILTEGNGGNVIAAFANVVAGSNYIVGIILFVIIMIVQLVVVTNGAGRVSEVSARFTLDAMPGKQMAIDSDLNSGLITEQDARKRRKDLQREADFYGSMDGASKFVKGDAIAGIVITLVNLIAGTIIFSLKGDLAITDALSQFGKLSIGDGLVSSIPSLLVSIASGIIVTRSDNNSSFGLDIAKDVVRYPQLFRIVGVILLVLAVVPGFPFLPFIIIGVLMFGASTLVTQNEQKVNIRQKKEEQTLALQRKKKEQEEDESVSSFQVEPIAIEIGYGLIPLVDSSVDNSLMNRIIAIRKQTARELGILVHPVRIRDNLYLESNDYSIKIRGNEVGKGEIYPDKFMIISPNDEKFPFKGIPTKEPAFKIDAMWIEEKDKEAADLQGFTIIEPLTVIATHLKEIIFAHAPELLGRQEVKKLLEGIKEQNNVVIDELIPDILRLGEVEKVLQNLLEEKIPINDLATILETLADYGTVTKDTEQLTEYVRQALRRTIAAKYAADDRSLNVVTIHPKVEELIMQSIQKTATGSYPVLKPDAVNRILEAVDKIQQELMMKNISFVILTSPKIRLAFRKLISFNFPNMAVLSLNEIPNELAIETVGNVSL